jgi:dTDP-4-amino-4,6-dideoxygalactose transaminase
MISLADPIFGTEEKQALDAVIDSNWLTMGEQVAAFEKAFAALHNVDSAVAVNSCTAGLHLCLASFGLRPGDEVLVPSLTFVATVNAIIYTGAKPVFVDIKDNNLPHISIEDAEAKCTPRTKAVVVMHYGGYLVDLAAWRSFADDHQLILIEDAAHAPGMTDVGRWGDAAAFSFFSNKNMTTAEGGMVLARDESVLKRIRCLRAHGMTTDTLNRHRGHAYTYDVIDLGFNYRLDELRAAIGLVQLTHLQRWNSLRRKLTAHYRACLSEELPEIDIPFNQDHPTAAHLMPIVLPKGIDRNRVMEQLRRLGIQTSIHYPPVHQFSYFRRRFPTTMLPRTDEFSARELTLPLHPTLTKDQIQFVIKSVRKTLSE